MKRVLIFPVLFFLAFAQIQVLAQEILCTPNPSKEAVALYRYLLDMKGKKILSGQMDSSWGIDEFSYIKTNTGKQPAIKGMDFITQSDNANEVQKAINYWKAGGIPTIMWHWGAPGVGEGYENSKVAINIDNCFVQGTKEYIAFWAELKVKADLLVKLRDANVPIIWRPFHELNGNWFWWGKQGSVRFKKLWTTMFNYFVNDRKLNNLIWTLCYTGQPDATWFPGRAYVDIAGADTYGAGDGPQMGMYNQVKTIVSDKLPIAYHECGIPPNPDQCLAQGGMWSWWMEWHTDYLTNMDKTYLKFLYNHQLVVTLDEIPNIMSVYGWNGDSCEASAIVAQTMIGNGAWLSTNKVNTGYNTNVKCKVQVSDSGTLSWSGYGTSGSSTEQTIVVDGSGTITVTFVNQCGATSTQTFYIVDTCIPTTLTPMLLVNGINMQSVASVTINAGSSVTLSPRPLTGGTWSWSGGGTSGTTRQQVITPDSSCVATAKFTNTCGRTTSLDFKITVQPIPTGISSLKGNPDVTILPVPCKESLTVNLNPEFTKSSSMVSVYTLQGTLVFKKVANYNSLTINTSGLKPGMYFLNIVNEGGSCSKKFLKVE